MFQCVSKFHGVNMFQWASPPLGPAGLWHPGPVSLHSIVHPACCLFTQVTRNKGNKQVNRYNFYIVQVYMYILHQQVIR